MRTVDPEAWWKRVRKAPLDLARPLRFGKKPPELTSGFSDALAEYRQNCSISGVKFITDKTNPAIIRYCYAGVLLLLLSFGLFAASASVSARSRSPRSWVAARAGLARDVPFPAVGLCANQLLSTQALLRYTDILMSKKQYENNTYSREAMTQSLAHFGHLLTLTLPEKLDPHFMSFLNWLDPKATVTSVLYNFAPNCSSMLLRCSWRGKLLPCRDLFQSRATPLGYCCIFNSRFYPNDVYKLPRFLDVVGEDYGLSVVVKQDFDDVSFFRRLSHDIDVLIFDGSDYPLLEGGGARLYPAQGNASVFLALSGALHHPQEGYGPDDEAARCGERGARGGRGRCLAECRGRALGALCACRLPALPARSPRPFCSHANLPCLAKHREEILQQHAPDAEQLQQQGAPPRAAECGHCAAACARLEYSASPAVTRHSLRATLKDHLLKGLPAENVTTIRLFYTSEYINTYEFHSNSAWYEIFVDIGSEWALIVGASVVSVSELVFHCGLRWRRRTLPQSHRTNCQGVERNAE